MGQKALPTKTVLTLYTPLSPMQRFWYKRLLLKESPALLAKLESEQRGHTAAADGEHEIRI